MFTKAAILISITWLSAVTMSWGGEPLHGFLDMRAGIRNQDDPQQKDSPLTEARLQLDWNRLGKHIEWQVRADLLADDVVDQDDLDLDRGTGYLDLREANMLFSPAPWADVKAGRQILTWGTGDLLFINDLFPKDWQSFFSGRDEEYLKAPSDAVFISLFPAFANIDIAYTPRFDSDRHISGERFSYWNPLTGGSSGRDAVIDPIHPDGDEISLRLSKNIAGYETAAYVHDGFWKSPAGFDGATGRATFPALRSYGASLRGPLGKGLLHAEAGYYSSRDDGNGDNPLVPNDETRLLIGYEREIAKELTATVQYYLERLNQYNDYLSTLPEGMPARDENRDLITLRLTKTAMSQNLTLSLFTFFGRTDKDGYMRPSIRYKLTDNWLITAGGNIFWGDEPHTFFGQFEDASNTYAGARYSF
ncbi:MAG: hypothetical protein QNK37_18215 [Acidobacteriota bacterium]|nr:hypothetical protein [Acidobacteriota bacterium]